MSKNLHTHKDDYLASSAEGIPLGHMAIEKQTIDIRNILSKYINLMYNSHF